MLLKLITAAVLLPYITAEIVYARTNRFDQAEVNSLRPQNVCSLVSMSIANAKCLQKENGNSTKCVGVPINKRFVLTRATDRSLNNYTDDSALRVATRPVNTKVVVCADDGVTCDNEKGLQQVSVKNIIYPQLVHRKQEYEVAELMSIADVALLELDEDLPSNTSICIHRSVFQYVSRECISRNHSADRPFHNGTWERQGERTCAEQYHMCLDSYTFLPSTEMSIKIVIG
ncbi:hypothetical protein PMAYCL1PPCAC_04973 [Pristionchus mayeri]|uniref:Uncharacterized protein n=1 Tax=Pristionchus mayeri TaxID=1317129 RepID=A0AAN4Z5K5_9BILA|nr:hypothetical protein PMAYCL1PPCAC_04973 [Pristionchus mayeri]